MKRKLLGIIFAILAVSGSAMAADDAIKVRVDGEYIEFDTDPMIVNDITMVPLRAVLESTGINVEWNQEEQKVITSKDDTEVILTIGSDIMNVSGADVQLEAPAFIEEERTMVPLRALTESYNFNVEWREAKRLVSIASVNPGVVQNTVDAPVKAVSHRGYHVSCPENSLEAYRQSRKMGFTYVEADIRFTKDNIPVLTHEYLLENVARNADGSELSRSYNIGNLTYEQLLEYDFGIAYGDEFAGMKITTFDEFIKLCDEENLYPYLDMKDNFYETQIDILINIVKKYDMLDRVVWCKYFSKVLEKLPDARFGYSCGSLDYSFLDDIANYSAAGTNIIVLSECDNNGFRDYYLNDFSQYAPVYGWTVNDKEAARQMCETGKVSGIYTDTINIAELMQDEWEINK